MSSTHSLIPFGLHSASNRLVDVASVPRGSNCGCVCPSCSLPLVARQGDVKEWHFAHHTRDSASGVLERCDFSLLMSIRLMFRQLAQDGVQYRAPEYRGSSKVTINATGRAKKCDFVVTKESLLTLDSQQVGAKFSGVEVDVLGVVNRVPFAIYCTYQGRGIPDELLSPETKQCGVLRFDMQSLATLFYQEKAGRYSEVLRRCIEKTTVGRSWLYHPRYDVAKADAEQRAKADLETQEILEISMPQTTYKCLSCGNRWRGTSDKCTECGSHLYSQRI